MAQENDGNYMYFEITDGPVMDAIKTWEESVRDCHKKANELREELGALDALWKDNKHNVVGFSFDCEPPKGFKHYAADPRGMFRPDSTKEGKSFRRQFEQFRPSGLYVIGELLGRQMVLGKNGSGFVLRSSHWKVYGKTYVAVVPIEGDKAYAPPVGLRPLTLSEHFSIKEAVA